MPTEPNKDLLIREIENPELKKRLSQFAYGIEEAVNFGTHIIPWCFEKGILNTDSVPPIGLLRHIIDLGDSISILVKNSSIDPCIVILRSLLETCWELEYMLEKDTKQRAMAFMVWYTYNEINKDKKVEPSFPESKDFQEILDKEIRSANPKMKSDPQIVERINNLQEILNQPLYLDAAREYKKHIEKHGKKQGKPKNWYSLFSGPQNVHDLAHHLKHSAMYERMYRIWSESTHGIDIFVGKIAPDGIIQLRFPEKVQEVTKDTLLIITNTYLFFIKGFIPEKENIFLEWYQREIEKFVSDLISTKNIIKVVD